MHVPCKECGLWVCGLHLQNVSVYNLTVQEQACDIQIRRKYDLEVDVHHEETDKIPTQDDPLESVAAQSCLEMDFTTEKVSQAIDDFYLRHGDFNFKAKDLFEILLEMDEQLNNTVNVKDVTTISTQPTHPETDNHDLFEILLNQIHQSRMCKICDIVHISLMAYHHLSTCHQCSMFQMPFIES